MFPSTRLKTFAKLDQQLRGCSLKTGTGEVPGSSLAYQPSLSEFSAVFFRNLLKYGQSERPPRRGYPLNSPRSLV